MHKRTTSKIFHRAKELRRNKSPEEEKLWSRLRNHQLDGTGFRTQHAIGNFIVDFCAPRKKLVIELDGSQHLETAESDAERTAFLNSKGYKVIRFFNYEINENIEDVLKRIQLAIGDVTENNRPDPHLVLPPFESARMGEGVGDV